MTALICGSFAFDTIMVFPDKFGRHILPDQLHILNVSFMVPRLRREFGGCAGNIAYNLNALGGKALPMGTVGEDFAPYAQWMDGHGIARTHVTQIPGAYTAQAFITTDIDDNQITAFHPVAMSESHRNRVGDATGVTFGIVSPDGRDVMTEHAEQLAETGDPFIFDPGQGLPMFGQADLRRFIEQADYVCVNDYEAKLLAMRAELDMDEITQRTRAFIITKGAEGSEIRVKGKIHDIPAVRAERVVDPTGCGDAYRAGILYGLERGFDWETSGRVASLLSSLKIEQAGTQNHVVTPEGFRKRFTDVFGYDLN